MGYRREHLPSPEAKREPKQLNKEQQVVIAPEWERDGKRGQKGCFDHMWPVSISGVFALSSTGPGDGRGVYVILSNLQNLPEDLQRKRESEVDEMRRRGIRKLGGD